MYNEKEVYVPIRSFHNCQNIENHFFMSCVQELFCFGFDRFK